MSTVEYWEDRYDEVSYDLAREEDARLDAESERDALRSKLEDIQTDIEILLKALDKGQLK